LTSSIYPRPANINFLGSVSSLIITAGGQDYTSPLIDIGAPNGTLASGTSSISGSGTVSSITIEFANQGSGYVSSPIVNIAAPTSGTQATGTANLSNGKVISITITDAGAGYVTAPIVVIDPPSVNAIQATATPTTSDGVITTLGAIGGTNTNYQDGESITITGTGINATATAIISGGIIQSVTLTNGGSGFSVESLVITGVTSTTATATIAATATADNVITSVAIDIAGSGYVTVPSVTVDPNGGGGADAMIVATISSIPAGDILSSDIAITDELVSPGGGGILRLYFSFNFNSTPGDITVTNNGVDKGALNADNDSQIVSNAYYRFDIDVESGDNINLELKGSASATSITSINFIRAHLVQFGA